MSTTTKLLAPTGISDSTVVQTEYGNYAVSGGAATVDSRAVPSLMAAGWTVFDGSGPGGTGTSDESRLAALEALPLVKAGKHTVTSGEGSAHTCSFATGLGTVTSFVVAILRAGKDVTNLAAVSEAAGNLTVADNGVNYALTAGDVVNWIAVGTL